MANGRLNVAIWHAGDDPRVAEIAFHLEKNDIAIQDGDCRSPVPHIVLVVPGVDASRLAQLCSTAMHTHPGSAAVVFHSAESEEGSAALAQLNLESLPACLDPSRLHTHLLSIVARWRRIERLKESAATLQRLESTIDLIYFDFRSDSGVFLPSPRLRSLVGLADSTGPTDARPLLERIHTDDRAVFAATLFEAARTGTPFCLPIRLKDCHGKLRHFRTRGRAFGSSGDEGSPRVFGVCEDMTDHIERLEEAEARSRVDELTGLGNRRHFDDCLSKAIERAKRESELMALLYIDLDRFKLINDTLGHDAGDQLLRIISARLEDAVRAQDLVCKDNDANSPQARVSRLGGDEFTVLLSDINEHADAEIVAKRMLRAIGEPIEIQGKTLSPAASIGIACFPTDGTSTDVLRKRADAALYAAKDSGGGFRFFSQKMEDGAIRRLSLESELRHAIDRDQIELLYEPRIDYQKNELVGAEALIHWISPTLGPIRPDEVLRIATETGLMGELGRWTLELACADATTWIAHSSTKFRVAINVSPAQFQHDDLFDCVVDSLKSSGLEPHLLDLEISEDLLLRPSPRIGDALEELRRIGVGIVLDEFGKGYSALGVLMNQPLDGLKLDRGLIETITPECEGSQIVSNIVRMALDLSLQPIGIGVSEEVQAKFLVAHGCPDMQGPLFSKPLTSNALRHFIENR